MPIKRSKTGPRPNEFKVTRHDRAHEGFLRVERVWADHKAYGEKDRFIETGRATEVMLRGDAVAAILYDPNNREVILVEQFRLPTAPLLRSRWVQGEPLKPGIGTHSGGWIVETVAGSLRESSETPEMCLRREVLEEAGYRVTDLRRIAEFFSSPGGTSEMIHLFYAEVTQIDKEPGAGEGAEGTGEDIDILHVPLDEFFVGLERREYQDPKIIIGGYWLRDFLARTPLGAKGTVKSEAYRLKDRNFVFGIKHGSIVDVTGCDVWINPENTNMQMDRYSGRTISAAIRWAGAKKRQGEAARAASSKVLHDTVAEELRRALDRRPHVGVGDIVETGPGELSDKGLKLILHAAVAEGFLEEGYRTDLETLKGVVTKSLDLIAYKNAWRAKYRSLLVPMMGTGSSGLHVRDVAPALVKVAVDHVRTTAPHGLESIYFNAYSVDDKSHLDAAFAALAESGVLEKLTEEAAPPTRS